MSLSVTIEIPARNARIKGLHPDFLCKASSEGHRAAACGHQANFDHIDVALAVGLHSTQSALCLIEAVGARHTGYSGLPDGLRLPGEGQ